MSVDEERRARFKRGLLLGLLLEVVTFTVMVIVLIVALTAFDAPTLPTAVVLGSMAFIIVFGGNVWLAFRARDGK